MSDDELSREWITENFTFSLKEEIQFGFHRKAGHNTFVTRSGCKAMLVDPPKGSGVVYGAVPMKKLTEFEVRLLDYNLSLRGSLKIGVMRKKVTGRYPADSAPKLSEHRDNSCLCFKSRFKEKTEFQNNLGGVHMLRYYGAVNFDGLRENDRLGLQLNRDGDLSFFVNGISQGMAARQIYKEGYEVYCFIELVEGYKSVEITKAGKSVLCMVYIILARREGKRGVYALGAFR